MTLKSRTFPGFEQVLMKSRTFPGPGGTHVKFPDFSRFPGPVGTMYIVYCGAVFHCSYQNEARSVVGRCADINDGCILK